LPATSVPPSTQVAVIGTALLPASGALTSTKVTVIEDDQSVDAIANEFAIYTTNKEPRLDLTDKLKLGGRDHEIPRAIRLKEEFAKSFTRNQLQASATRRYIRLLAEVDSRFNTHVYPAIATGASLTETTNLIRLGLLTQSSRAPKR